MIDNESGEDYLEAILRLSAEKKDVHAVDVARELGVSKPAVTKAMRILTGWTPKRRKRMPAAWSTSSARRPTGQ